MAISFDTIPNLLLTPGFFGEYNASRAITGLAVIPNRVLLIGARSASGTALANTLVRIRSKTDGSRLFGRGSQLDGMIRAFKGENETTELWAIGATAAGTAATKTITVTGTATTAGTMHFWVGGKRVDVAIPNGTAAAAAGPLIDAAFALYEADWMYTFAAAAGVVTGTARHAAAFGQQFDIRLNYGEREADDMPAGLTVVIADGVAGATDPDLATTIAALGDNWFTTIVTGFNLDANMDILETYAEGQWGPMVQQDTMIITAFSGIHADFLTYLASRNNALSIVFNIGVAPTPFWEQAAAAAGAAVLMTDPARPRQRLQVNGILPPAAELVYDRTDRELLLEGGGSTFLVASDGTVLIERMVTTYTTNADGLADSTFRNYETLLTLFAFRYTLRARITAKYPNHKLADDNANYGPGQKVVTPKVLRGEYIAIARIWEINGWLENVDQYKADLIIERNADDRDRVDALLAPDMVNQFRVNAAQIQFII